MDTGTINRLVPFALVRHMQNELLADWCKKQEDLQILGKARPGAINAAANMVSKTLELCKGQLSDAVDAMEQALKMAREVKR